MDKLAEKRASRANEEKAALFTDFLRPKRLGEVRFEEGNDDVIVKLLFREIVREGRRYKKRRSRVVQRLTALFRHNLVMYSLRLTTIDFIYDKQRYMYTSISIT